MGNEEFEKEDRVETSGNDSTNLYPDNKSYLTLFSEIFSSNKFLLVAVLTTVYTVATFDFNANILSMIVTLVIDGLLLGGLWLVFLGGKNVDSLNKIDQGLSLLRVRYIIWQVIFWIVAIFCTLGFSYLAAEYSIALMYFMAYIGLMVLTFLRLRSAKKIIKSIRHGCKENEFAVLPNIKLLTITSYIYVGFSIFTSILFVLFAKEILIALYEFINTINPETPPLTYAELNSLGQVSYTGIVFALISHFCTVYTIILLKDFNKQLIERTESLIRETIIINVDDK